MNSLQQASELAVRYWKDLYCCDVRVDADDIFEFDRYWLLTPRLLAKPKKPLLLGPSRTVLVDSAAAKIVSLSSGSSRFQVECYRRFRDIHRVLDHAVDIHFDAWGEEGEEESRLAEFDARCVFFTAALQEFAGLSGTVSSQVIRLIRQKAAAVVSMSSEAQQSGLVERLNEVAHVQARGLLYSP